LADPAGLLATEEEALDPADDPLGEALRCLKRGAAGLKLHPRGRGSRSTTDGSTTCSHSPTRDGSPS
jgi:hypothetical protein